VYLVVGHDSFICVTYFTCKDVLKGLLTLAFFTMACSPLIADNMPRLRRFCPVFSICVAAWDSVLQYVVVCCNVSRCVAVFCCVLQSVICDARGHSPASEDVGVPD